MFFRIVIFPTALAVVIGYGLLFSMVACDLMPESQIGGGLLGLAISVFSVICSIFLIDLLYKQKGE